MVFLQYIHATIILPAQRFQKSKALISTVLFTLSPIRWRRNVMKLIKNCDDQNRWVKTLQTRYNLSKSNNENFQILSQVLTFQMTGLNISDTLFCYCSNFQECLSMKDFTFWDFRVWQCRITLPWNVSTWVLCTNMALKHCEFEHRISF